MKNASNVSIATMLFIAGLSVANGQTALAQDSSATDKQVAAVSPAVPDVSDRMDIRDITPTDTLHIVVGRSTVLRGTNPLKRVYIGNPAVLQSFTAGPSEIVLTAKVPGISSLVLWDTIGKSRLYTVAADVDPDALRDTLRDAYPTSRISVEGLEGRIYLKGTVPTQEVADSAAKNQR